MHRRDFLAGAAVLASAGAAPTARAADVFPSHAITIVNPFPPGGVAEVVTRPLAGVLEPIVKVPVVLESKIGAAGAVGAQVAASAKPDGYTLLAHLTSISGFAEVDKLFGRSPKFTRSDFVPLARLIADPCVLIANDQTPWKSLQEFVADAQSRPNAIVMSSSGLYGALHLPMALFSKAAKLQLRHLPTTGGGPALTALLGNTAQVMCSSVAASLSQIRAGKVRPLALFGSRRSRVLPDTPTLRELGQDVEYYLWVGLFAPKAVPAAIVTQLGQNVKQAALSDPFKRLMANLGQEVDYLDQQQFAAFLDTDALRVEAAVRQIGKIEG